MKETTLLPDTRYHNQINILFDYEFEELPNYMLEDMDIIIFSLINGIL